MKRHLAQSTLPFAPKRVLVAGNTFPASSQEQTQTVAHRNDGTLPELSQEQEAVIQNLLRGVCVQLSAAAGSGKTTLSIAWMERAIRIDTESKALILQYNKDLKLDTRRKLRERGLQDSVACESFHSLVKNQCGLKCANDTDLTKILDLWKDGISLPVRCNVTYLCVDEAQDMTDAFYELLCWIFGDGTIMLVVGDLKQQLYIYKEGADKARACYIENAPTLYQRFCPGRPWMNMKLTISFRLTPNVAQFVNACWGTDIVAGNTESANNPVEYWHLHAFKDVEVITQRIAAAIDSVGMENVMILKQTVKNDNSNNPLAQVLTRLGELKTVGEHPKRKFNIQRSSDESSGTSAQQAAQRKDKVRAWTFCASKGSEASVVIVWGLSAFNMSLAKEQINQMGVALSRAKSRLIVLHEKSTDRNPIDYFPTFNRAKLEALVDDGVVKLIDDLPSHVHVVDRIQEKILWATDVNHLSARTMLRLLSPIEWTQSTGTVPVSVTTQHKFYTGEKPTVEDVSALYGIAVPFFVEWQRTGRIRDVEQVVNCRLLIKSLHSYSLLTLIFKLREQGVIDIDSQHGGEKRPSGKLENLQDYLETTLFSKGGTVKGLSIIEFFRENNELLDSSDGLIGVMDEAKFDSTFLPHCDALKGVYRKEIKHPSDFVLLANARQAYGDSQHLFKQIGTTPEYYHWVDIGAFTRLADNLLQNIPSGTVFEKTDIITLPKPLRLGSKAYIAIGAKKDGFLQDEESITVFENKFSSDGLSNAHKIQLIVGAAIVACKKRSNVRCKLVNYKTDESAEAILSCACADRFLRDLCEALRISQL